VKSKNIQLEIEDIEYPNIGIARYNSKKLKIKNTLPDQKVNLFLKRRKAILIGIAEKSPKEIMPKCIIFDKCGGCTYQNLEYTDELELKKYMVLSLFEKSNISNFDFLGIEGTPNESYRNKMEYSFGDEYKDGPLSLGLRMSNAFYQVVNNKDCNIVDNDFNTLLFFVLDFFKDTAETFYNRKNHTGTLRYFVIRKGINTGEIFLNLFTTSTFSTNLDNFVKQILNLKINAKIVGIIHTISDNVADTIFPQITNYLYGNNHYIESVFGLKFKIYPMAFFQTNTKGAEILYNHVLDFLKQCEKINIVYDLYCGTGTIAQIVSGVAKKVIGIDIVEESIIAAKENTQINNITNCHFFCGDVKDALSNIEDVPDVIILDPPREGLHPKALKKVLDFNVKEIIYISCKPTSFVKDLLVFIENGYKLKRLQLVDMFPRTAHVEAIGLIVNY